MKSLWIFLILSCYICSQEIPPATQGSFGNRYAFLIAMWDYDDDKLDISSKKILSDNGQKKDKDTVVNLEEIITNFKYVLMDVGFAEENIVLLRNPTLTEYKVHHKKFVRKIEEHNIKAERDQTAPVEVMLWFFIGHGVTYNEERYLLLRNLKKTTTYIECFREGAIHVNDLLKKFSPPKNETKNKQFNLFLIESCATPITLGNLGAENDEFPTFKPPQGVKVVYAADIGQSAYTGVFSKNFMKYIKTPGLEIDVLTSHVINGVASDTKEKQIPVTSGNKRGFFYFCPIDPQMQNLQKILEKKIQDFISTWSISVPDVKITQREYDVLCQKMSALEKAYDTLNNEIIEYAGKYQSFCGYMEIRTEELSTHIELQKTRLALAATRISIIPSAPEGFVYLRNTIYTCGNQKNIVYEYLHEKTGIEFVYIEGGTFQMGKNRYAHETPVHTVTLSPYFISKTEITQQTWQKVMGNNPSWFSGKKNRGLNAGLNAPIEYVSWEECQNFCQKVGLLLPTEAQWEYAARGGSTQDFICGDNAESLENYAWFKTKNAAATTHPVASLHPNAYGLYDTHGNVWEWCHDWYSSYSTGMEIDPKGPEIGSYRVIRGGCWGLYAESCCVTNRLSFSTNARDTCIGFRVVYVPVKTSKF